MGSNDIITIFFLVLAVVIFLQLRNVLGRRTGSEKPPFDPYSMRESGESQARQEKVVSVTRNDDGAEALNPYAGADAFAAPGSDVNSELRKMIDADPSFNPKEFMQGARSAYEMIVTAFAQGDRGMLKNLLSKEVFEGFEAALNERDARGEKVKSTFVGIDKADLLHASVKDSEASVTVRMVSQLISATYDKDGNVVDGHPEEVAEVKDIWTFARDIRSRDPNWKLVGTESEH